tara:strand:- start:106 stop:366 length:261 start_codon:yes stop_codon:yes gene_type:complete
MTETKQILPKWFNGELYTDGGIVSNPFTGVEVELTAEELSMYDFIKGAEYYMAISGKQNDKLADDMHKGLTWFAKNNIEAYMTLLD